MPPTLFETRKRFTRDEFDRILDADLFDGQRLELLDGDLINKMGQTPPHASAIQLLLQFLMGQFGVGRVRGQFPIEVATPDRERNLFLRLLCRN